MSDSVRDVPRERSVPPRLLRYLGISCASAGVVLLAAGVLEKAGRTGAGLVAIAIGVMLVVASIALLAPLAPRREHPRESRLAPEVQREVEPRTRRDG